MAIVETERPRELDELELIPVLPEEPEPGPIEAGLLRAIDYLEEHGWCQGIVRSREGMVCLSGALISASGFEWDTTEFYTGWYEGRYEKQKRFSNTLHEFVTERLPEPPKVIREALSVARWQNIPRFNDWTETTEDDVIGVLRRCVEDARRMGA